MRPTRSLRGQGELLAHVPYQLGITPTDSVVVVGFDEAHTIVVTLRLDPPGSDQKSAVAALFAQGRLSRLVHATLIVTGPDEQVLTGALVVRDALEANGIAVGHVHSVDYRERTWQTERCDCGQCPQGAERLPEAHGIGAVLDAAVRGIDPSLTRAQLEQGCRPTPAEEEIALLVGRHRATPLEAAVRERALAELVDPGAALPTDPLTLAAATQAVQQVGVRDGLMHWVRPDTFPPPTGRDRLLGRDCPPSPPAHLRPAIVARLVRWACRVPDQDAVPIWACVAALEWARGGGPLATIALEAALDADPDYPLANLVYECLMFGVLPTPSDPPAA